MRGKFLAAMIVIALGVGARGFFSPADARVSLEKCTLCHGKPEFRKILVDGQIRDLLATEETLKGSVHEKKTCVDCHFDVSEIPHRQRPKRVVCTHCHYKGNAEGAPQSDPYLEYFGSVHGTAIARGNTKAPLCQDCHGSHAIRKAKDPASAVARRGVAETCGRCHIEIYAQYKTSIHGVALSKEIPNIPPTEDPLSMVNPKNVPATCGKCHPGANPNFAVGKMHVDSHKKESGVIYYTALFFKYITIGTMLALIAHIFLDMYGRSKRLRGER